MERFVHRRRKVGTATRRDDFSGLATLRKENQSQTRDLLARLSTLLYIHHEIDSEENYLLV